MGVEPGEGERLLWACGPGAGGRVIEGTGRKFLKLKREVEVKDMFQQPPTHERCEKYPRGSLLERRRVLEKCLEVRVGHRTRWLTDTSRQEWPGKPDRDRESRHGRWRRPASREAGAGPAGLRIGQC